jgi:hypothetical protein
MIANQPPTVSFENPAMASAYDHYIPANFNVTHSTHGAGSFGLNQISPNILAQLAVEGSSFYNDDLSTIIVVLSVPCLYPQSYVTNHCLACSKCCTLLIS